MLAELFLPTDEGEDEGYVPTLLSTFCALSSSSSVPKVGVALARRAEAELRQVVAGQPFLKACCERAEIILARHLAMPRVGLIRARVWPGGELVCYLVTDSSGQVYRVEPFGSWRCSCSNKRPYAQAGCVHALAAWALWRAAGKLSG